jgi:transposase
VLTLTGSARIFVALGATDMRKSFDTLAQEVRAALGEDPLGGSVFVFSNRARTRIKVLWFDRGGFWLLARRLERGTFAWPKAESKLPTRIELRASELAVLLDGIDLSGSRRRAWYERAAR